jgi:hypothetical protein
MMAALGMVHSLSHAEHAVSGKEKVEKSMQKLKASCQADVDKLCSDVTPGEGRIGACLNSKEDQLSADCKTAWVDAKTRISQKMDQAQVNFRKNCGPDVQKFCANVPAGRGRLLDCLGDHETDLSGSCTMFMSEVQKKAAEYLG